MRNAAWTPNLLKLAGEAAHGCTLVASDLQVRKKHFDVGNQPEGGLGEGSLKLSSGRPDLAQRAKHPPALPPTWLAKWPQGLSGRQIG